VGNKNKKKKQVNKKNNKKKKKENNKRSKKKNRHTRKTSWTDTQPHASIQPNTATLRQTRTETHGQTWHDVFLFLSVFFFILFLICIYKQKAGKQEEEGKE
jgi:hypothetical protein